MSLDDDIRRRLRQLEQTGLRRSRPQISRRHGVEYHLDGRPVLGFCSNDYLGLHDLAPMAADAPLPMGSTASRLICGDVEPHRALERELADLLRTHDAVFFPSGYQANVSALPALLDAGDCVHSDRLNHASIIDGLRLSAASRHVLDHLRPPPSSASAQGDWWVLESTYSMDGDGPAPTDLRAHVDAGGHLYVDEAHAVGLHEGGRGLVSSLKLSAHVVVATLGKAFGASGAVIAGSAPLCDWIRNRGRGYVFSTGPSPRLCEDLRRHVDVVRGPDGDRRRATLRQNMAHLADAIGVPVSTPIVPLAIGDNTAALDIGAALLERGLHVQPIRPPTVPEGTARLRLTITAAHRPEHIDLLASVLAETFDRRDLPLTRHVSAGPLPREATA